MEGMRSGRPEEALVALRLALAEVLARDAAPSLPNRTLSLSCDFDAGGRLVEVRGAPGTSATFLSWIKRGAARLITPEALLGQPFSLDVVLEAQEEGRGSVQ